MICFSLRCFNGHEYDAWFRDSESYEKQQEMHLVACPQCGVCEVSKAIMAPNLKLTSKKSDNTPLVSPEQQAKHKIRELVTYVMAHFEDLGESFPEEARRIQNGESEARTIYGQATLEEAKELLDDGIEICILPDVPSDA